MYLTLPSTWRQSEGEGGVRVRVGCRWGGVEWCFFVRGGEGRGVNAVGVGGAEGQGLRLERPSERGEASGLKAAGAWEEGESLCRVLQGVQGVQGAGCRSCGAPV